MSFEHAITSTGISHEEASCSVTGSFDTCQCVLMSCFPSWEKHVSSQYQRVLNPSVLCSQKFFFPSLSFIPFLSTQGLAHMMAEQGMPLYLFSIMSLFCLCFQCGVAWFGVEYIWKCMVLYIVYYQIECDFIFLLYCSTKPECRNHILNYNKFTVLQWSQRISSGL